MKKKESKENLQTKGGLPLKWRFFGSNSGPRTQATFDLSELYARWLTRVHRGFHLLAFRLLIKATWQA